MHTIVRLSVYAAIHGVMLVGNVVWYRKAGRRPIPLRLLLYVTGLMFSVALVEELGH